MFYDSQASGESASSKLMSVEHLDRHARAVGVLDIEGRFVEGPFHYHEAAPLARHQLLQACLLFF